MMRAGGIVLIVPACVLLGACAAEDPPVMPGQTVGTVVPQSTVIAPAPANVVTAPAAAHTPLLQKSAASSGPMPTVAVARNSTSSASLVGNARALQPVERAPDHPVQGVAVATTPATALPPAVVAAASSPVSDAAALQSPAVAIPKPVPTRSSPIKGWLTDYVTASVSLFDASGRVIERVPRTRVPLPPGGLAFHAGPNDLVLANVNGGDVLLDTSEFKAKMAAPLVEDTCEKLRQRGLAPRSTSPASMGHGDCR